MSLETYSGDFLDSVREEIDFSPLLSLLSMQPALSGPPVSLVPIGSL
jgi:hypothetical protein